METKKVKKVTFPPCQSHLLHKWILTSCPWRFPERYGHVAYGKATSSWKWWLRRLEQKSELPTSKCSLSGAQLLLLGTCVYLHPQNMWNPMEQNKESQIYHGLPASKLTHPCPIRARKKRPLVSEVGLWLVAFTKIMVQPTKYICIVEHDGIWIWGISKPIQSIQPTRFEIVQHMIWKLLSLEWLKKANPRNKYCTNVSFKVVCFGKNLQKNSKGTFLYRGLEKWSILVPNSISFQKILLGWVEPTLSIHQPWPCSSKTPPKTLTGDWAMPKRCMWKPRGLYPGFPAWDMFKGLHGMLLKYSTLEKLWKSKGTTHPISPHLGNKAFIRRYGIMVVNNPLTRPSILGGGGSGSALEFQWKCFHSEFGSSKSHTCASLTAGTGWWGWRREPPQEQTTWNYTLKKNNIISH